MSNGWIAVDLDGTLAEYHGWQGIEHIGPPVPLMLSRVTQWLSEGIDVRIFTARVHPDNIEVDLALKPIEEWCVRYLGVILPVTYQKDFDMVELWDDRAVQIITNTGIRADRSE